MDNRDMQLLSEQYFRFEGISSKKKQQRIFDILSYCKEIRNTAYPMANSNITELEVVEFAAHKEKDHIYINGSMSLVDGDRSENRWLTAYIFEYPDEDKSRVYMEIERLCVDDEPKLIRTTEEITEVDNTITTVTVYASGDASEQKNFVEVFEKNETELQTSLKKNIQLSAL